MPTTIEAFDFSVNVLKAIIWEYDKAPNTIALMQAKQVWYDENQTAFWNDWYTDVFDLRTANDFGCVVWAIILGLPITLITGPVPNTTTPWGFDAFNLSNFDPGPPGFNFSSSGTSEITFTLEEKRLILQLRYRQIIARGTIPEANKVLSDLIEPMYGGMSYMLDGYDMTETLVALFPIPYKLNVILTQYDLIIRPAGVKLKVVDASIPIFGFGPDPGQPANGWQNFTHGGFLPF